MHHRLSPLPLCALVCPRVCRCLCTVARQMAHRLVPRGRGGGVGLKPIRHASVAWRRVVAQPPEWACLSQPKRWRGGMRTSAACTCTAVCVRERVRARRRSRAAVPVEAARLRPSVAAAGARRDALGWRALHLPTISRSSSFFNSPRKSRTRELPSCSVSRGFPSARSFGGRVWTLTRSDDGQQR